MAVNIQRVGGSGSDANDLTTSVRIPNGKTLTFETPSEGFAAPDLSNPEAQATVLPVKVAAGLRSAYSDLALARDDVLAYWKLGEASGSAIDSSPSALTGTLVGSVTRGSASLSDYPSDYATTFSGAGAFNLGNVLNFDRTDKWTVEFLITPLVVANGSNYAVISKLRSSAPFTGWEVNLEGTSTTTARIGVYVGNSFPSGCILVKSAELLSVGTTYHVAVSCEPSGRGFSLAAATLQLPNIRIWIDGREQPLSGVDEVNAYGTVASTLVHSGNCYIGSQSNDSRRLNAVLDELAVYRGVVEYSYIKQRALLAVSQSAIALARSVETPPRNLILDFDINTDCDDMGDLHEALALRACGKLNLIGIITSTKSNSAAPAAQAILDYWSVSSSSVPIGAYQGSLGEGSDASVSGGVRDQFRPGDTRANYSDDLTVYRTVLAAAEDNSVSIVSTGFAISLKRLMDSPADGISIYTGAQLIARKVAVLVLVGNVYPYNATASVEYNAASDPASWEQVIETWPTPLVFSGGELGEFVKTAPPINFNDRYLNPTRFAYYSFVTDNSRQSWGQLGMYWIAHPERFALSRAFTQTVNSSTGQASVPNYTDAGTRYFLRLADKSTTIVQRELNALLFPVSYPNQTPLRVTASTASTTLNPKQSGQLFNNIGATAIVPFALPAAVAGLNFRFSVLDADGIRVTAASGDTIRVGASVSAAAGKIESTTIGDYVHLVAMDDTQWVASPATGTWTAT